MIYQLSLNLFLHTTLFIINIHSTTAANFRGIINLDLWTFDKIIEKFSFSLVRFGVSFHNDEYQKEFNEIAESAQMINNLLLADVGISAFDDGDDVAISSRFGIKKLDYPVLRLFINGVDEPIPYTLKNFTAEQIKTFLITNAGIHLSSPYCIYEFDKMAVEFMQSDENVKKEILKVGRMKYESVDSNLPKKSVEIYLKFMTHVIEKGNSFVETELNRLAKIKKGKLIKQQSNDIQKKINILQKFVLQTPKDEL